MDIQAKKLELVRMILDTETPILLLQVEEILIKSNEQRNSDIPEFHKEILNERLADMEANPDDVISWEEVQKKYESRL